MPRLPLQTKNKRLYMKPLKILFANAPFDGHFNPLTGVALHLKAAGHDVRWYTQDVYAPKLKKFGIDHYPFRKAVQLNQHNLDSVFAQRLMYQGQIKRLNFDLQNAFILRAPECFDDIEEINETFSFDVLIADVMFMALPLVRHVLKKPVIAVGVLPLVETSKDLPPPGLGMTPNYSWFGQLRQGILRFITDKVLFRESHQMYRNIMSTYGIEARGNTMDFLVKSATFFLQSGTPGFEYRRSDLGKNIRYIGALLPVQTQKAVATGSFQMRALMYKKVILVTQGTIEKDPRKLIVPTLEAYKDTDYLVVATTGGSGTAALREKYPHSNLIIEDFIPFADVLPFTDVYVSNGGYGGVMLSIGHGVPMVVAGVHEGKNEINARVGYFRLGVDLKTETPSADQIRDAVAGVLAHGEYKTNTVTLQREFTDHHPGRLAEKYVREAVNQEEEVVQHELSMQQ